MKTLDHGVGPAITFTRASNATFFDANGTLQTAANDTPRFDHDPATGASRGLLIEESRTNSIVQSEDFSTTWSIGAAPAGIAITTNQTAAPDGLSNADLLETTLVNQFHSIGNTQTWAAGAYTFSVFAKYEDHQWITLRTGVGGDIKFATFDIQNAVTGTATAGVTHSITSVGGGWYRLAMTATLATAGSQAALIILNDADDLNNTAYTGTGTGVFLWGAQLEAGAFATSYIPTTTAAATRAADSAVVTPISSFYNQSEGTLFVEATTAAFAAYRYLASASNSGNLADRAFDMAKSTNNEFEFFVNLSTVSQANPKISPWNGSGVNKAIAAVATDNVGAALNGSAAVVDSSAAIPTNTNRLTLGQRADGGLPLNGHIRKIAYWPRRLSNTLLQQLTT